MGNLYLYPNSATLASTLLFQSVSLKPFELLYKTWVKYQALPVSEDEQRISTFMPFTVFTELWSFVNCSMPILFTLNHIFMNLDTNIKHYETISENKNCNFTYFFYRIMPLCNIWYGNRVLSLNLFEIFLRHMVLPRRDIAVGGILVLHDTVVPWNKSVGFT